MIPEASRRRPSAERQDGWTRLRTEGEEPVWRFGGPGCSASVERTAVLSSWVGGGEVCRNIGIRLSFSIYVIYNIALKKRIQVVIL